MKEFRPAKKRVDVSVGESVRILRELQEFSQSQLAELTGISQATISAIENGRVNLVGLTVTITRCVHGPDENTGDPPTPEQLNEDSEQTDADAWALWNHLWSLWCPAGLLLATCSEVFWDGLRPVPTSGLCSGWTLHLRVQLDGYPETFGS